MLALKAENHVPGDLAVIRSPPLGPYTATSLCMQLWVSMEEVEEGTLRVYVEVLICLC